MAEPPPEAALVPTAATAFGPAALLCGRLMNTVVDSHLASTHGESVGASWSAAVQKTFGNASSETAPRRPAVFATNGWSPDDLMLLETTQRGKLLVARMVGTGGRTVEQFSEPGQLATTLALCKGEVAFSKAASEALRRLARNTECGGLALNWVQLGFDLKGDFGAVCFTCNAGGGDAFKLGSAPRSGPFQNLLDHCKKRPKHEKARNAILAQIDALLADPRTEVSRYAPPAPPRPPRAPPRVPHPPEPSARAPLAGRSSPHSCSPHA